MATDAEKEKIWTRKEVERLHIEADTDAADGAIHHTLGPRKGQAAPGDHDHRGGNSVALLQGVKLTGSRSGGTALVNIIAALVDLGAEDATTA